MPIHRRWMFGVVAGMGRTAAIRIKCYVAVAIARLLYFARNRILVIKFQSFIFSTLILYLSMAQMC